MSAVEEPRGLWYFTFGVGQANAGRYVTVGNATFAEARELMCLRFGREWAFQYSADDWVEDGRTMAERYGLRLLG